MNVVVVLTCDGLQDYLCEVGPEEETTVKLPAGLPCVRGDMLTF